MNEAQYNRYNRHLLLAEIGVEGQEKLLRSKVLVVGVGGLGSPAAIYLAAAGVGTIGLIEFDVIDLSNLQRQILYETAHIGLPKVEIAAARLKNINPDVQIIPYPERLTSHNALNIFAQYDYILDATDNFATRYLINDASVLLGKTYIFGSIYSFEGQITVFGAAHGPCYRCLFPSAPNPEKIQGSLDLGIFGVLPGVVGSLQATEAIKLICGIGDSLIGRLMLYDALTMEVREVKIAKNPNCPICGNQPAITSLGGYEAMRGMEPPPDSIPKLSAAELYERLKSPDELLLLDVRDNFEYQAVSIEQALHISLLCLDNELDQIEPYRHKQIVSFCQTGPRGLIAARALNARGFKRSSVLSEGLSGWIKNGYPTKICWEGK